MRNSSYKRIVRALDARVSFRIILHYASKTASPGVKFLVNSKKRVKNISHVVFFSLVSFCYVSFSKHKEVLEKKIFQHLTSASSLHT